MSNTIPIQVRSIDPYSSYNSNVVNQLTRIISRGVDCLDHIHAINVSLDLDNVTSGLIISPGQCYKDDVIVQITEEFDVDMSDKDFYLNENDERDHWDETGYYYILLSYQYEKALPAPQASIVIIKPTQRYDYILNPSGYLFLKCVEVEWTGSIFQIKTLYDHDPENPSIHRLYSQVYVGYERTLPTFVHDRDHSRIVYVEEQDTIYFGGFSEWITIDILKIAIDTSNCSVGQLIYVGADGKAYPAKADNPLTFSDGFVTNTGTPVSLGLIRLYGYGEYIPIEAGITLSIGDRLYLSATDDGAVTNLISTPYSQAVGKCIAIPSATYCTILYMPGNSSITGGTSAGIDDEFLSFHELFNCSIFKQMFIDTFYNTDYIDPSSTSVINPTYHRVDGDDGDTFISLSLTSDEYLGDHIDRAQISTHTSDDENFEWYISNDGGLNWEYATINRLHTFGTVDIPVDSWSGSTEFIPGEWVQGSVSGKQGTVEGQTSSKVLLANVTGLGTWAVTENLVTMREPGLDVVSCRISGEPTTRFSNTDLMVKANYLGTGYIQDYCVLYDVDTEKDETSIANERNIDTLYGDLYEHPTLKNDGLRCYPFDSTEFPDLAIIYPEDTVVRAVARLDEAVSTLGGTSNLVTSEGSGYTPGHIAIFDNVSGTRIVDGGVPGGAGSGDVVGPYGYTATTDEIVAFDGTTGTLIKGTGILISEVAAGTAGGDLSGTYPNPTVEKVNGITLSALSNGLLAIDSGQPKTAISAIDIKTINGNSILGSGNIEISAGGGLPSGPAGGDLSGIYPNPNVAKINGTTLSILATGILKNTTGTGKPSIAVPGSDYLAPFGSQTKNHVYAAPSGSNGSPLFRALVASDFSSLFSGTIATPGYIIFPNGFIIQWGRTNDDGNTKSFPIAFPNSCFAVFGCVNEDDWEGTYDHSVSSYIVSTSQFRIYAGTSANPNHVYMYWVAIGN